MGGDALLGAGEAQLLLGGGFHVHLVRLHLHPGGQVVPHFFDIGGQLGLLGQNGGVHVAHLVPLLLQQLHHMVQQLQAVRPRVGRVGVREVPSDVPQSRRSQQGVHHRVGEHVRV